jgi:hypothetical protein
MHACAHFSKLLTLLCVLYAHYVTCLPSQEDDQAADKVQQVEHAGLPPAVCAYYERYMFCKL